MNSSLRLHAGHAILAALALLAMFLGWRAWAALVAPIPQMPALAPPQLADRALLARFDPFFRMRPGGTDLPVTALPFSLHGLRADSATGRGSAIIAAGDGQQTVYSVGDAVGPGVTLVKITVDHVVLDRAGVQEALWLDNAGAAAVSSYSPPVAPPPDAPPISPEAEIDAMVARSAADNMVARSAAANALARSAKSSQPDHSKGGAAMMPAAPPEPK